MKIDKAGISGGAVTLDAAELAQIHRQSRRKLNAEEVYAFAVKLCDNEIDRDGERFPVESLQRLAELFVGKSGLFDHQWSAKEQCARIYRTELVTTEEENSLGEPYAYVKGYAYMLRSAEHESLMNEIEAGIKREVSISCAAGERRCSICGEALELCGHQIGREYDGVRCYGELRDICDAYEWSFVAVPAQPRAGVMKGKRKETGAMDWQTVKKSHPQMAEEIDRLLAQAELGRHYLKGLRQEVARLGGLAVPELGAQGMERVVARLGEEDLLAMKDAYEKQLAHTLPLATQLPVQDEAGKKTERAQSAFLI